VTVQEDYLAKDEVILRCSHHGEFNTTIKKVINNKYQCKRCMFSSLDILKQNTPEDLLTIFHSLGSKFEYLNKTNMSNDNIKIKCHKCNNTSVVSYSNHLKMLRRDIDSQSCNSCCKSGTSIAEKEIVNFIKSITDDNIVTNSKKIIPPLEIDIYTEKSNIAIEYNGIMFHNTYTNPYSGEPKLKNYHINKTNSCEHKNIHLITIYEDQWRDKKDIVKSRLSNLFGKGTAIYARKCDIREVGTKESSIFMENNHIQGNVGANIKLGLYYDNELVSVMTFGKLRPSVGAKSTIGSYELLRFCSKLNHYVVGGASKLFKYFIKTFNPDYILSYADRNWSTTISKDTVYSKLGFINTGVTRPNYYYYDSSFTRYHRYTYRKDVLVNKFGYDNSLTEQDITKKMGLLRVYDSGSIKYEWYKK
jgi:hypothetical protein